jgi:beta-glucanase (GH16 family)
MPSGIGVWPALWLLGANLLDGVAWPHCGELDILENTGAHPFQVQGTIHGDGYFGENGLTQNHSITNELFQVSFIPTRLIGPLTTSNGFLTIFATTQLIEQMLNQQGKPWPFNQEFYLIMNLAIGGWFAGDVDPELKVLN